MVVLVTGGAGYIGSQLIRDLAKEEGFAGSTIRILDNMMRERYVSLWGLPKKAKYEFIEGDVRKKDDLKQAFKDVDVVFDLAGITNAPLSFKRKALTMDVNYKGWKKILDVAVDSGVEKFIYASTASVYGPTSGLVDENYECKPASPYGETKYLAEKACIKAYKERGLKTRALRLGTVFGFSVGMRFDTVVDRFTYLACIGAPLTVWVGAENAKRPYLHIFDAVQALIFANDDRLIGKVHNIVSQNASLSEVIAAIRKFVPDIKIKKVHVEVLNQLSYELDDRRIRKLGFQPQYDLENGVKMMVDKFQRLLDSRPQLK